MGPRSELEGAAAFATSMLFAALGLGTLLLVTIYAEPAEDTDRLVLVFAPQFSEIDSINAVAAADGAILGFGATGNVVIAAFTDQDRQSVMAASGAVTAFDPGKIEGCFTYSN